VFPVTGVQTCALPISDVESYMAAKLRLFDTLLPEDGAVVVEPSAPAADRVLDVASERGLRTITVGEGGKDLALTGIEHDGFIQRSEERRVGEESTQRG